MTTLRRLQLFVRDYLGEFGVAWSIARTRDCERNGGHRWGDWARENQSGLTRSCSRCKCSEYRTASVSAATNARNIWVSSAALGETRNTTGDPQ